MLDDFKASTSHFALFILFTCLGLIFYLPFGHLEMKLFINVYFSCDTLYFIVLSIQRHKQNLNGRDKAVTDLAMEFDVKGANGPFSICHQWFVWNAEVILWDALLLSLKFLFCPHWTLLIFSFSSSIHDTYYNYGLVLVVP